MSHPAWKPRGSEWAALAPGVAFLLRPVTGELQAVVNATVLKAEVARDHPARRGRAVLEDLGRDWSPHEAACAGGSVFDPEDMGMLLGDLADLEKLAGLSVLVGAILYAAGGA